MKKITAFICIVFCIGFFSYAQNNTSNISNLSTITENEFKLLKDSKEGDIVMIKESGTIYYFSGQQWYALKGECYPKPISSEIDSLSIVNEKLYIYFDDSNANFQEYIIKNMTTNNETIVQKSPAVLSTKELNGNNTFTILGFNKCGKNGPVSFKAIDIQNTNSKDE